MISITSYILNEQHAEINDVGQYDIIISAAEEIIDNSHVSNIDTQFAYLEALHALYQKIKYSIQINPSSAAPDIQKAFKYLKKVSGSIDDSFGHIANLYGLINLWSGIAEIRTRKKADGLKHLNRAIIYFDEALEKNSNKYEFLNHKTVALQQLHDLNDSPEVHARLMETYDRIRLLNPSYYKANLNYAGTLIRDVRKELGLDSLDTFPDYRKSLSNRCNDCDHLLESIDKAKEALRIVQQSAPQFINGHYKMGEALTLEIILCVYKRQSPRLVKAVIDAQKSFETSRKIAPNAIACKYCQYAFEQLIGNTDGAEEIKKDILNTVSAKSHEAINP